jgi:hypothetical protein
MRKETRADRIVITPPRVWRKPRKIAAFSFHNFEKGRIAFKIK